MVYISATEAAKRLGVSEKTVRRWIDEKRLTAFHPHGYTNRLAIAEQDVEQLKRERAEYEQPGHKRGPAKEDVSSLAKEVEKLRGEVFDLKSSVVALEQLYYKLQGQTPGLDGDASLRPLQSHTEPLKKKPGRPAGSFTAEPPKEIPSGSMLIKAFAEKYGVPSMTFRDHVKIGRYGEKVEAMKIFKRETAKGPEYEYWLTPEQQRATLDFWKRHNVPFTLPHEQDQEEQP